MVEEPNSASKHGVRVKVFSLVVGCSEPCIKVGKTVKKVIFTAFVCSFELPTERKFCSKPPTSREELSVVMRKRTDQKALLMFISLGMIANVT